MLAILAAAAVLAAGDGPIEAGVGVRLAYGGYDGLDVAGWGPALELRGSLSPTLSLWTGWSRSDLSGRKVDESGEHTDPWCELFTLGLEDCTWHDTKRTRKVDLVVDEFLVGAAFRFPIEGAPGLELEATLGLGAVRTEVREELRVRTLGQPIRHESEREESWGGAGRAGVRVRYALGRVVSLEGGVDLAMAGVEGPGGRDHLLWTLGATLGFAVGF